MKFFVMLLTTASLLTATGTIGRARIAEEHMCDSPHRPLPVIQGNMVLADSSGNAYSAWTQIQECLSFNPSVGGLQFVNRGYAPTGDLYVHQTDANFSFWIHDFVYNNSLLGNARYPTSIAANNPGVSFTVIDPLTMTGHKSFVVETGGWFSGMWTTVENPTCDPGVVRCIGKQLPNGNFIFIAILTDGTLEFEVFSSDLIIQLNAGDFGTCNYWGFDVNGGICYVFYYDDTFDLYYRTTVDGITWSPETQWEITYPSPYTNNYVDWTQMVVTDAGNPVLVFDIGDADDATYPWDHKTYVHTISGAAPVQVSDIMYTCSWYPTIAAGGDYVVVLMHVWTNGLQDSLARHDLFYNCSDDNGATWQTPRIITSSVLERPGLAQLSKRLNVSDHKFYYFYGVDMIIDHDPLFHLYLDPEGLDPMAWYVGWHSITIPGVEENKQCPTVQKQNIQIYPNPFKNKADIRFQITDNSKFDLHVYDAAGELVKSFPRSTPGTFRPTQITWYGDDNSGRPVPAGIYFVQLKNRNTPVAGKIIKLE
jgi:hypothetical protein